MDIFGRVAGSWALRLEAEMQQGRSIFESGKVELLIT